MKASKKAVDLIIQFEGFKSKPYKCPAGIPTIGYGLTSYPDTGEKVTMKDDPITEAEAQAFLREFLRTIEAGLLARFGDKLTQNQFDALVSWVYNLGFGNLDASTLSRKLKEGKLREAAQEILRWNKANGQELAGLTRRRRAEYELFTTR